MDFFLAFGFFDLVDGAFTWSARHSARVNVDIIQLYKNSDKYLQI